MAMKMMKKFSSEREKIISLTAAAVALGVYVAKVAHRMLSKMESHKAFGIEFMNKNTQRKIIKLSCPKGFEFIKATYFEYDSHRDVYGASFMARKDGVLREFEFVIDSELNFFHNRVTNYAKIPYQSLNQVVVWWNVDSFLTVIEKIRTDKSCHEYYSQFRGWKSIIEKLKKYTK